MNRSRGGDGKFQIDTEVFNNIMKAKTEERSPDGQGDIRITSRRIDGRVQMDVEISEQHH